jgi:predicted heme/steroid binding protein
MEKKKGEEKPKAKKEEEKVEKKEDKKKPQTAPGGLTTKNIITSILLVFVGVFSAFYLATDGDMEISTIKADPNYQWFVRVGKEYREQLSELVFGAREGLVFTPEELSQYDGTDPSKPIYIALKGRVYDVSAGPGYYGKEGSYSYFSGKDASRAYITGCWDTDLIPDLRGLNELQLNVIWC